MDQMRIDILGVGIERSQKQQQSIIEIENRNQEQNKEIEQLKKQNEQYYRQISEFKKKMTRVSNVEIYQSQGNVQQMKQRTIEQTQTDDNEIDDLINKNIQQINDLEDDDELEKLVKLSSHIITDDISKNFKSGGNNNDESKDQLIDRYKQMLDQKEQTIIGQNSLLKKYTQDYNQIKKSE